MQDKEDKDGLLFTWAAGRTCLRLSHRSAAAWRGSHCEGRFSLASHLNEWVSKAIKREAKKDFETWTIELPPPRRSADSHSLTKRISSQRYSLFWVHGGHRTSLDSETEPFSVKMKHQRKWISPQDQTAEFLRWGDKYAAVAAAAHCAGVQSYEPPATRQAEM